MTPEHDLMTPEEVAIYLRLDEQTTYRLLRAGTLPGVKIGRQWRIWRANLDTLLRAPGTVSIDGESG
jgi:excisionase family DNA binding protein